MRLVDTIEYPPHRRHTGHRAERLFTIPQHRNPRDRVRAISDRYRQIRELPVRTTGPSTSPSFPYWTGTSPHSQPVSPHPHERRRLERARRGLQLLHDPGDIGVRTEFHDLSRHDGRDEDDLEVDGSSGG